MVTVLPLSLLFCDSLNPPHMPPLRWHCAFELVSGGFHFHERLFAYSRLFFAQLISGLHCHSQRNSFPHSHSLWFPRKPTFQHISHSSPSFSCVGLNSHFPILSRISLPSLQSPDTASPSPKAQKVSVSSSPRKANIAMSPSPTASSSSSPHSLALQQDFTQRHRASSASVSDHSRSDSKTGSPTHSGRPRADSKIVETKGVPYRSPG